MIKVELEKRCKIKNQKGEPISDMMSLKAQIIYAESYYDKWLILVSHVDSAGNILRHASYNIVDNAAFINSKRKVENWGKIEDSSKYKFYYATKEQKKFFNQYLSKTLGVKFVSTLNKLIDRK